MYRWFARIKRRLPRAEARHPDSEFCDCRRSPSPTRPGPGHAARRKRKSKVKTRTLENRKGAASGCKTLKRLQVTSLKVEVQEWGCGAGKRKILRTEVR